MTPSIAREWTVKWQGVMVMLQQPYRSAGYLILRQVVAPTQVEKLTQLVSWAAQPKRKVSLLANQPIVQRVDGIVVPLFQTVAIAVDELVELYLLVAQAAHVVKLGWHRDAKVGDGIHSFQLPLLPGDNIHQVVPGTHARAINAAEIAARNAGGNAMPNAVRIELTVGDILLRSPFLLHRGYGLQGVDRLTLVGTYAEVQ